MGTHMGYTVSPAVAIGLYPMPPTGHETAHMRIHELDCPEGLEWGQWPTPISELIADIDRSFP